MNDDTFHGLVNLLYQTSGIVLEDSHRNLVQHRVTRCQRALGLPDTAAYLTHLRQSPGTPDMVDFINAMSTNLTSFMRDPEQFERLAERLRRWASEGKQRFRLWSAAASTGEEPYSMGVTALESLPHGADVRILCTDICTEAIATAQAGRYTEDRLAPIGPILRNRYFSRVEGEHTPTLFTARPKLRDVMIFRRLNLMVPLDLKGNLDIIFCRNVLIYFDRATRERVVRALIEQLAPGGMLFVGLTDSISIHKDLGVVPVGSSVFRRPLA